MLTGIDNTLTTSLRNLIFATDDCSLCSYELKISDDICTKKDKIKTKAFHKVKDRVLLDQLEHAVQLFVS